MPKQLMGKTAKAEVKATRKIVSLLFRIPAVGEQIGIVQTLIGLVFRGMALLQMLNVAWTTHLTARAIALDPSAIAALAFLAASAGLFAFSIYSSVKPNEREVHRGRSAR